MPLKLYKRGKIWHYRGTVAGNRLRRPTGTTDRGLAAREASEIERQHYKRHLDGPEEVLTFPQAVKLYLQAHTPTKRSKKYIERVEDYWKDARVKDMAHGAIRQSAIDIHPNDAAQTRNRQVITVTLALPPVLSRPATSLAGCQTPFRSVCTNACVLPRLSR